MGFGCFIYLFLITHGDREKRDLILITLKGHVQLHLQGVLFYLRTKLKVTLRINLIIY